MTGWQKKLFSFPFHRFPRMNAMKHVRTFSESMKTEMASAPSGKPLLTSNTIKFHDSEFWLTFKRAGRRCLLYFIEQHQLLVLAHKYSFVVYNATSSIFSLSFTQRNHNLRVLSKEVPNFLLRVEGAYVRTLQTVHISWLLREAMASRERVSTGVKHNL